MKSAIEEARDLLDILPEDASMDDIITGLSFKARVLRAHEEALRGEVFTHEEVVKRLSKWLDPIGLAPASEA